MQWRKLNKSDWTRTVWDSYFILLYLQMYRVNVTALKETLHCRKHHIRYTINIYSGSRLLWSLWVPRFLITLSRGYKNLHYLTQFIVTIFTCIKNNNIYFKKTYVVLPVVWLHLVVPEWIAHTHDAHSKLENRMLLSNNETGNCQTNHLSFRLLWYLDRDTKCIQMVS
jgi:hypothetical protein